MAGPNDNAILDLLALQGDPAAPDNLDSTLAMLIRNNGGSPIPAVNPLAADANGYNLPRTDKVNTTGAVERINAASPKWYPGVTATTQENGTVSLSNLPPVGAPAPVSSNISNDLFSSINSLKTTADPDTARGLLSNIRQSAAEKSTSLNAEAMKFASSKLGVPALEQQLREAEAADRADEAWYPGIGDSPITAKIRQNLLSTRASVDNEAKNYLATNTTYASMNAALKTAEEEAKRIDAIAARRDRLTDELSLRAELKQDAKVEEAATLRATLSPEEQRRLTLLNPSIGMEQDPDKQMLAMAATIKRADRDPNMREALGASEQDLPVLAMSGNADALTLVASNEKERNPNATDESIAATLQIIARGAGKPALIDSYIKGKYGTKFDSLEAKAEKASLSATGVGLDAQGKAIKRRQDMAMALDVYRAQATDRFMGDTASWGITDPEIVAAQGEAYKVTGRKDMGSVLTALLKSSEGDPAMSLQKLQGFKLLAQLAAKKQGKSMFGTPDSVLIDAQIDQAARTTGLWDAIKKVLYTPSTDATSFAPLGIMGAGALGVTNYMNNK